MNSSRRTFFKNLTIFSVTAALFPTSFLSQNQELYKINYTVTGDSDEAIKTYLKMMDGNGVKANNNKMQTEGMIVNKTRFERVSNGRYECSLWFKSERAFKKFLDTSRPMLSEIYEFKKNNNIQISLKAVS